MAKKRRKKTSKKNSKFLVYVLWSLVFIVLVLSALIGGYYVGYKEAKEDFSSELKHTKAQERLTHKESSKKQQTQSINKRLKEVLEKNHTELGAAHEYEAGEKIDDEVTLPRVSTKALKSKPKLAIIIDDVSFKSHVNAIKSLHMPITMSFLPPSSRHPNSAKLAAKENFYMVHLPMEAQNFTKEEPFTLRVSDSKEKILNRIKEIKRLFPHVAYINNHTGSKFTSNMVAMERLIYALKNQNIHFVDSRTTAKTKASQVMKEFGYKYMARDVFLDHHTDKAYVKEQIKRAIAIAKSHGSAIAIAHPHANTIAALSESKQLLKDVELVYIKGLY